MDYSLEQFQRDSYPANKKILSALPGPKGHLLCRIYWATNLRDRVCKMSLLRLGIEIGYDSSTVSRAIADLLGAGYIDKIKGSTNLQPAHYVVTEKFFDLFGIAERNPGIAERKQERDKERDKSDLISKEKAFEFLSELRRHSVYKPLLDTCTAQLSPDGTKLILTPDNDFSRYQATRPGIVSHFAQQPFIPLTVVFNTELPENAVETILEGIE